MYTKKEPRTHRNQETTNGKNQDISKDQNYKRCHKRPSTRVKDLVNNSKGADIKSQ